MSLVQKVKDYMYGIDEYGEGNEYEEPYYNGYEYDDEQEQEEVKQVRKPAKKTTEPQKETVSSNIIKLPNNQKSYVVISTPKNIGDSLLIIDSVKDSKLCIVNLEGVGQEDAQKIADFLSGAVYALNGEIQRVSNDIFVCAADNVDITGAIKETLKSSSTGILPWLAKN